MYSMYVPSVVTVRCLTFLNLAASALSPRISCSKREIGDSDNALQTIPQTDALAINLLNVSLISFKALGD